jgi:uncharacterized protein
MVTEPAAHAKHRCTGLHPPTRSAHSAGHALTVATTQPTRVAAGAAFQFARRSRSVPSVTAWAVPFAVVVVASAVQSVTGFGFSIAALPVLTLLFGVRNGIDINLVVSAVTNAGIAWQHRHEAIREIGRPLLLGGVVGLIPGLLVFHLAAARTLRIAIAVVLALAAGTFLLGVRYRLTQCRTGSLAAGALSGCLQGSIALGGPPVSLYLSSIGLPKRAYRGTVATFFVIPNAINVPIHLIASPPSHPWRDLMLASSLLIVVPLGNWIGRAAFPHLGQLWFDRIVLTLVLLAASIATYQALATSSHAQAHARARGSDPAIHVEQFLLLPYNLIPQPSLGRSVI